MPQHCCCHNSIFLASPPLVVVYALAGSVMVDLSHEPLGHDPDGCPVLLADLWPDAAEVDRVVASCIEPQMYCDVYATIFDGDENWQRLPAPTGATFVWDESSDYLRRPPFARCPSREDRLGDLVGARALVHLGDSVTTDHICPAGRVPSGGAAARYLTGRGVPVRDLNSYASRRGNWEVMRRGGFSNPRLENRLVGGPGRGLTADLTRDSEDGGPVLDEVVAVADRHAETGTPLLVLAGREYGTGSSRDWAAKVTSLLGVRAVRAQSFERIHRSNLVGMGVLPLQFRDGDSADSLGLDGTETYDVTGLSGASTAPREAPVVATHPASGRATAFDVTVRLYTPREVTYLRRGGLLPFVLDQLLETATEPQERP